MVDEIDYREHLCLTHLLVEKPLLSHSVKDETCNLRCHLRSLEKIRISHDLENRGQGNHAFVRTTES